MLPLAFHRLALGRIGALIWIASRIGMASRIAFIYTAVAITTESAGAQLQPSEGTSYEGPKIAPYEFTGDLRALPVPPPLEAAVVRPYRPLHPRPTPTKTPPAAAPVQEAPSVTTPLISMPTPLQNFAGIGPQSVCGGSPCDLGIPPDTNGDVGLNHYVQAVNEAYAVYNKNGTLLAAFTENQLWAAAGATPCNGSAFGDPIVLYDALADRWILTHLAAKSLTVGPFYQCIAASKTSDPVTGGWYLYPVQMDPGGIGKPPANTLNDYPKFGVWHDCLYMSAN